MLTRVSHPAPACRFPIGAVLTLLSTPKPICQNGCIGKWYPIGMPSGGDGIGDDMARSRTIRVVSPFQYDHPVLYFLFVAPVRGMGKLWFKMLLGKNQWWAFLPITPLHRIAYFGPPQFGAHAARPIFLVVAGTAKRKSTSSPIGDIEPNTEELDLSAVNAGKDDR